MVGSVGKRYSKADRAYIAGLFDCDGAIMASIEPHKEKKYRFRVRVILKFTQKHPNLPQWLQSFSDVGIIRRNRTTYDWVVRDQGHCKELLELMQAFSRGKAKQIQFALQILNTSITSRSDLQKVAYLADALSTLNVRSLGRRKNYASKIEEYFSSND